MIIGCIFIWSYFKKRAIISLYVFQLLKLIGLAVLETLDSLKSVFITCKPGVSYCIELFSWKSTSHKDRLEVFLPYSRLPSGILGMWTSMKITLPPASTFILIIILCVNVLGLKLNLYAGPYGHYLSSLSN